MKSNHTNEEYNWFQKLIAIIGAIIGIIGIISTIIGIIIIIKLILK